MRLPEAIEYLTDHGVPYRTACRLSATVHEWGLIRGPGSGRQIDYSHEMMEAFRVYWSPLFDSGKNGTGRTQNAKRFALFMNVWRWGCQQADVIVKADGMVLVEAESWHPSVFVGGAAVIPVHRECVAVKYGHDSVGAYRAG